MTAPDRALPGWAIDLITDGVPQADLKAEGGKAIRGALSRTAMSAQARGWTYPQWHAQVLEAGRGLGQQVRQKAPGKPRTDRELSRELTGAWDWAAERLKENAGRPAVVAVSTWRPADRAGQRQTLLGLLLPSTDARPGGEGR